MNGWEILAAVWGTPFVAIAAWVYVDRGLARRRAARRLAAAEQAFWEAMAAYLERAGKSAEEQVHFSAWEREIQS